MGSGITPSSRELGIETLILCRALSGASSPTASRRRSGAGLAPATPKERTAYDAALALTGADVSAYWRPSKASYLSRLTREQLLEIGRELARQGVGGQACRPEEGPARRRPRLGLRLAGSERRDTGASPRLKSWLPEGMSFGGSADVQAGEGQGQAVEARVWSRVIRRPVRPHPAPGGAGGQLVAGAARPRHSCFVENAEVAPSAGDTRGPIPEPCYPRRCVSAVGGRSVRETQRGLTISSGW